MEKIVWEISLFAVLFSLESVYPFFNFNTDRKRHAVTNISMGILNTVVVMTFFSTLMVETTRWTEARSFGLFNMIEISPMMKGVAVFILFDLWMYLWHAANHRLSFLWRFHRVHHSDKNLDTTSAFRFHVGEIIFSSCLRLMVIPLLGVEFIHLFVYEFCLQPVIIFHHSNVALPEKWDRLLRTLVVTPNMHRIHHSKVVSETNSNYSSIFSWWDRIAKTFRMRSDVHEVEYGLQEFREPEWQTFGGMIKTPFINLKVAPR